MSKKIKSIKIIDPGTNPDVDSDFHTIGRGKTIEHIMDLYGADKVAGIITPGPFKAKNAIKSMATIYGLPTAQAQAISNTLPDAIEKKMNIKSMLDPNSEYYEAGADLRIQLNTPLLEEVAHSAAELDGRLRETGVHPCFIGNSLVLTNKGLKEIKNIKKNDLVLTHKNQYQPVKILQKNFNQKGVKLSFKNIPSIITTTNHPFYTLNIRNKTKSWKNAEDLEINKDLVAIAINQNEIIPNNEYNLPLENEDFWWLIGQFLDNGSLDTYYNSNSHTFKHKIRLRVPKKNRTKKSITDKVEQLFKLEKSDRNNDDVLIINDNLYSFLKPFYNKSYEKEIPSFMFDLPIKYIRPFLHGLFSDYGKPSNYFFTTNSDKLINGIIQLAAKAWKSLPFNLTELKTAKNTTYSFNITPYSKHIEFDNNLWTNPIYSKKTKISQAVYNLSVLDDNSYTVNNISVHNCGMLISSRPIKEVVPVQIRQDDGLSVTQWNYYNCEALGLIKMDFLGLVTVDLIDEAIKNVKRTRGIDINVNDLVQSDLDDKKTYKLFSNAETTAIFQFSSSGVKEMLRELQPTEFMDLAAVTALYRPGPMGLNSHLEFAQRKNNPNVRIPVHKSFYGTKVEELLKDTYGLVVYQEDCMRIAKECAGFTPKEADDLRKAIGKKKMALMKSLGGKFIDGMINNGYDPEAVELLWNGIVAFGEYAFNKSHSVSYALNAYIAGYLKAHYPVEFMAAALKLNDSPEKIREYIAEIKRMNLKIQPASVNESEILITPSQKEPNTIIYGLSGIKRFPKSLAESIVIERNKNGLFKSITDFVSRLNKYENLSVSSLKTLALTGAFDCLNVTRKSVVDNADKLLKNAQKIENLNKRKNLFSIVGVETSNEIKLSEDEYSYSVQAKYEADLTELFLSRHPLDKIEQPEIHLDDKQVEVKGLYVTFPKVEVKTTKQKAKYMQIVTDNKISRNTLRVNRDLMRGIEKYTAIQKFGNQAAEKLGIANDPQKMDIFNSTKAIPMPIENIVYQVDIITPKFKRNNVEVYGNPQITSLRRVPLSHEGYIVNGLRVKSKKLREKYIERLKENPGNDVIRLIYPDKTFDDINNVKFMPGTTQNDLNNIEKEL